MLIQPTSEPLPRGDGASLAPSRQALTTLRDGLRRLVAFEVGPATVAALLGVRPGEARAWLAGLGLSTPAQVGRLMAHLPPVEDELDADADLEPADAVRALPLAGVDRRHAPA